MAACNASSQPQIKDLGLESTEVSEKEDLKDDSKEKRLQKRESSREMFHQMWTKR